jgi:amino acid transporter
MQTRKPNDRDTLQQRVQGTRVHGSHPADEAIRVERYPYAAPSPIENLLYWLIGSPIRSSLSLNERLSKLKALAVFSSDPLSSVAYATEEILLVLVLAGAGAFALSIPIAITIAILLFIVAVSYNQTIHAYPSGGGAYIVAKDNLGTFPGLVAGAALLVDYVLTVAVSVSSGVAAIVSALPSSEVFRVEMAVGFILLITVANLRGLRESSTIFMAPTYIFVGSIYLLIGAGLFRYFLLHDTSVAATANVLPPDVAESLGVFLILRAFASGCTALTGVEAISNGVPAFKPPESRNAAHTLSVMAAIAISMFLGITLLARLYPVIPEADHETVISQLGRTVFGEGPMWVALQVATTLILVLAANTSFADFPRLSAIMARDGFLPRVFVRIGQRLVFTTGILMLAFLSIVLTVSFGASTHNLIPLYAIGVFVSFSLSQAGMVRHWWRLRGPHWRRSSIINSIGALATAVVLSVLVITKFRDGAYIVVILIPILVFSFTRIKHHYDLFQEQVRLDGTGYPSAQSNIIIVPVEHVDRISERTLSVAQTIRGQIDAVHVRSPLEDGQALDERWAQSHAQTPLQIIDTQTSSVAQALLAYIHRVGIEHPEARIVVMVPERAPRHVWDLFLHNRTSLRLKLALLFEPNKIVVSVPHDERFDQDPDYMAGNHNIVVIPIARVDKATLRTLSFANTLAGTKTAVFIYADTVEAQQMRKEWDAAHIDIPLLSIESPYRSVTGPLLKYIDSQAKEQRDANIVVALPEIIPRSRWQLFLHNQTVAPIKYVLLFRPRNRILISVPFHLVR